MNIKKLMDLCLISAGLITVMALLLLTLYIPRDNKKIKAYQELQVENACLRTAIRWEQIAIPHLPEMVQNELDLICEQVRQGGNKK